MTRTIVDRAGRLISSPKRRWFVAGLVIVVATALVVAHASLARMGESFAYADWHWLIVAMALMFASIGLGSAALAVIVNALGGVHARLGETFSATSIGLLANSIVPVRMGTVIAPYALYVLLRRRGVTLPFVTTLGLTLTEELFAAATLIVLSLLFVSLLPLPPWALPLLILSALVALTLLAAGIVVEHRRRRLLAASTTARATAPAAGKLRRLLPALLDSQRIMGKPWSVLLVIALEMLTCLVQLITVWSVLQAFHLGAGGLRAAGLVLVLTNLISLVAITPGNVGTFQAAAVAALAACGVAAEPALAFALGLQFLQFAVGAVAGLASLGLQDLTLADLRMRSHRAASQL
ncbi:MAG: lysylphosphatidylglycerol synthase transmembrane domain-containing protein [Thermoleophilia bacterium]